MGYVTLHEIVMRLYCSTLFLCTLALAADEPKAETPAVALTPATLGDLRFRLVGPAMISGRVVDIAVEPGNAAHYYVAAASGGVWKTGNNGASWTPVFDGQGSYSIGALAMDPKNPDTVWVGTGEANSQRSVSYGDGVYRTDDGGKTWKNLGLKTSEHIARIAIDPRDSKVVYVAAQGPLWAPGGERGLYKTTDGGKTWKAVLTISPNTGVTDVAIDPRNPDVVIAASYQRRRHFWTLIDGGPESAIYRSTDAGATWSKAGGLPAEDIGRITFAPSGKNPALVYASVEAANRKSGIYRSTDFGASWELRSPREFAGMYFGRIYADPHTADRVYFFAERMAVSDDGGRTFRNMGERNKHGDTHLIWIDPRDADHYLVGCDGGLYETFDRAQTWAFKSNLPLAQFYDIAVDNQAPFYNVYGGTQDNASVGGPARTRNITGITNADWFMTQGGDGFVSRVDPEDPNIIYAESQNGVLARFDKRTGESVNNLQPQPEKGEDPARWNWDSPLIISPHAHTRLYFGNQRLYRSDDRGNSWKAISPDLTQQIDRNKLPVMGKVWGPDAVAKNTSTAYYSNISSIAESPKKEGLIYAGTDDGILQITEDGGGHWRKSNDFPGVPEHSYVSRVIASQHDANTAYSAFENHQSGDFNPYLMKTTDGGRTWRSIRGDLPVNGAVYAFAEDHKDPNLLFAGTEYGVFFSADGGVKWMRLRAGLPTIAVRDIAIQKQQDDLVIGTFGRGIYVLDDYSALLSLKPETLQAESHLFPVRETPMYVQAGPYGRQGKGYQGDAFYAAENPAYGATFTWYLKSALKTRAERRREAEKKGTVVYPSAEEFRAEAREEAPAVVFLISDAEGRAVRRLAGSGAAGIHRITWDLREPAPVLANPAQPGAEGGGDEEFAGPPSGPLVMPGNYQVSMAQRVDGELKPLAGSATFTISVPGQASMAKEDRAVLVSFQQKTARLQRAVTGALEVANGNMGRLAAIRRALFETPGAPAELANTVAALEKKNEAILVALRGDSVLRGRSEPTGPSINERVMQIVQGQRMSTARPTGTQMHGYDIAAADFKAQLAQLTTLVSTDMRKLEQQVELAGAPHTPGRLVEFREK